VSRRVDFEALVFFPHGLVGSLEIAPLGVSLALVRIGIPPKNEMTTDTIVQISDRIRQARQRLVRMHYEAGIGHLGGNLSCLDAMMVLHHTVLRPEDAFVLSKGHSVGAYYIVLWSLGLLSDADLKTFCRDGTRLPGHPSCHAQPEILFSTGSLGHGLSLAVGLALSGKLRHRHRTVWCLMSDGEWQEGACWEALILARRNDLDNLVVLVDVNRLQGFGTTEDVARFSDLPERIAGFGVQVTRVPGHNVTELCSALSPVPGHGPRVLCLETVKGHGLSFFENRMESHYLPLTETQYLQARQELADLA